MTVNRTEQISLLLDGEADHAEIHALIEYLERDPEAQRAWERYHLIGDAMKKNLPRGIDAEFALRVHQALDGEGNLKSPWVSWRPSLRREYGIGLALAASVATAALLGVQWIRYSEPLSQPPTATLSTAATQLAASSPPPPSSHESGLPDDRLNGYLIDHSAYAASTGMQGIIPYVRVVGYPSR